MTLVNVLLILHIAAGSVCLATGLAAALARKSKGIHTAAGEVYHGAYVVILITSVWMAVIHWTESAYLLFIGIFSYSFALLGYLARKLRRPGWLTRHISGMIGSYIAIVTAILVVNGPHIPYLNQLPPLTLWFLPTLIGSPIIYRFRTRASAAGLGINPPRSGRK